MSSCGTPRAFRREVPPTRKEWPKIECQSCSFHICWHLATTTDLVRLTRSPPLVCYPNKDSCIVVQVDARRCIAFTGHRTLA